MLNSFIYMFKDENFWKKSFALFGILLTANLLINWSGIYSPTLNEGKTSVLYYVLFFAGLMVMFIPYGYSISVLKAKLNDTSFCELPAIKLLDNFVSGFKLVLSGLILVAVLSLFMYILYSLNNFCMNLFGEMISVLFNTILFLFCFIVSFLFISMCCRYVVKPSFLNFVNFKDAVMLIKCDVLKYFKSYLLVVLCTVFVNILTFLSVSVLTQIGYVGLVIYCIIVSVLWTYQIYLFAGLFSNAVSIENIK